MSRYCLNYCIRKFLMLSNTLHGIILPCVYCIVSYVYMYMLLFDMTCFTVYIQSLHTTVHSYRVLYCIFCKCINVSLCKVSHSSCDVAVLPYIWINLILYVLELFFFINFIYSNTNQCLRPMRLCITLTNTFQQKKTERIDSTEEWRGDVGLGS